MASLPSPVAADVVLDVEGLSCPLPILKARKALSSLAPGTVLEVRATDPGSVADFAAFCGTTGHALLSHSTDAGVYRFLIRKRVA